ncbi:type III secretion system protein [Cupriavidus sp. UYMSc13B]|nr:type III secretion system protein [Cupriavidus sp. UYMSc13B]
MTVLTQQLFYGELGALGLAYARVAPVFYLVPFLNDRIISNTVLKNTTIFIVIAGIWQAIGHPPPESGAALIWIAVRELTVGLVLGVALSSPFWIANAIGELIDNQRGATISASMDPATGVEASVLAPFLSLFCTAVFLEQGGMISIMEAIYESYTYLPAGTTPHADVWQFGSLLTQLMGKGVALAAPVLLTMFLSDVILGLFSRFCPHVNAFSMSLSVKSVMGFVVFYLYFPEAGPHAMKALFYLHRFPDLVH